ncbi:MAG: hypothetical protein E6K94_05540 [Thaumarchaeota archaeon]|nr:MAG: hypothetical protein E6K94_05540 [Nitrososphaerota archaeon]
MSLCYDTEKWIMISLASVAITLVIGLVSLAHGQELNMTQQSERERHVVNPNLVPESDETIQHVIDYCFEHATTSLNPIQDLINAGIISSNFAGTDCKSIQSEITNRDYQRRYEAFAEESRQKLADAFGIK